MADASDGERDQLIQRLRLLEARLDVMRAPSQVVLRDEDDDAGRVARRLRYLADRVEVARARLEEGGG